MAKQANPVTRGMMVRRERLLWRFSLLVVIILAVWVLSWWGFVLRQRQYDYRYKRYIQSQYIPWVMTTKKQWPASLNLVERCLQERPTPDHPFVLLSHRHGKPVLRVLSSGEARFEGELQFRWRFGETYRISARKLAAEIGFGPAPGEEGSGDAGSLSPGTGRGG